MSKLRLKAKIANAGPILTPLQKKVKEELTKVGVISNWWGPKGKPAFRLYIDPYKTNFNLFPNSKTVNYWIDYYFRDNLKSGYDKKDLGYIYVKFSNASTCSDPSFSIYIKRYTGGEDIRRAVEYMGEILSFILDIINQTRESSQPETPSEVKDLVKSLNQINEESDETED